jgi:hypothetical protein
MITSIYLTTKHDRHIDDENIAFTNLNAAINQCKDWMEMYDPKYYDFKENKEMGYPYYADCEEDYFVKVEVIALRD